ncbi:MAG: galactose ABC transporter substrate-binding protein [Clostridium sp.]|nr:galactose ABC transporter substrate-binding protein [Clostridium sp.]
MKVKQIWIECVICCISILLLCACGEREITAGNKIYVGVVYYDQSDTFLGQLLDCLKEQFDELESTDFEVRMAIREAAGSQRKQNEQVKELIYAGCDVLCVNLVDRTDPSDIIDIARENGVPIIFFNREPVAEDIMRWDKLYYVGADAKQSGILQGEMVVDAIQEDSRLDRNKDGKIQYVVLEGEPSHQDAIMRTENAVDTLKNNGIQLEKLGYGIANWNRAQAQNRMMQMIGEHQNAIELVLANNDDMALGAIDAYKQLNYTETDLPVFFGIDGTDVGLNAVVDLELSGTVYNDKESQAAAIARLAIAVVSQEGLDELDLKNDKYIYLPYAKVTADNVGDFLMKK